MTDSPTPANAAARLALALESPLREQLIARHKAMLMATLEEHRK